MIVKTHRDGCDNTGLHIGRVNARRYFRRLSHSIDLKLDDLQIQLAGFSLHRPTLDDVFLSLTGHVAEDTDGAKPAQKGRRGRGRSGEG